MLIYCNNLANASFNDEKKVSYKSVICKKSIEPAGFVYFLKYEWNLHIDYDGKWES